MSQPQQRRYIAPRRVIEAFGPNATEAFLAFVIDADGRSLHVQALSGDEIDLTVIDPAAVTTALERDDLSRVRGNPLVLANCRHRLFAIAVGPLQPPNQLEVEASVVKLGPTGAVEIPGTEGQPSWLLFEIEGNDGIGPAANHAHPEASSNEV
jgi:hypothetical protein